VRVKTLPLLSCGFRPFFLLTSAYAVFLIGVWTFSWQGWLPMPTSEGGPIVWHAYELIYGFTLAAIIGFLLTATPEFVPAKEINGGQLLSLVLLWIGGRVVFWLSASLGLVPAAVLNLSLLVAIIVLLAPPIWRDSGRPHMSFIYALFSLGIIEAGFFVNGFRGAAMMPWLYAAIGAVMVLIVIALSRISMRVINGLEEGIDLYGDKEVEYLARPPRRNLAMLTISLFTLVEFFAPGNNITGWLALASGAAMFNLLNDWHIGRPLFNRWVFGLYSIYWLMALGYFLMGLSILADWSLISAARHILVIGAIGFSIFLIMIFAGQVHCGQELKYRHWMTIGIVAILDAVVFRIMMAIPAFAAHSSLLLILSGELWVTSFMLYFIYFWRNLTVPARDGRTGCL